MINLNNVFAQWTLMIYQACQPIPAGVVPPAQPPVGVHYAGGQVCYSFNSKHPLVGVKRREYKKHPDDAMKECLRAKEMMEYRERMRAKWSLVGNCSVKTVHVYW